MTRNELRTCYKNIWLEKSLVCCTEVNHYLHFNHFCFTDKWNSVTFLRTWQKTLKWLYEHGPHNVIYILLLDFVFKYCVWQCVCPVRIVLCICTSLCNCLAVLVMHMFWYKCYLISKEESVSECIIALFVKWAPLRLWTRLWWVCGLLPLSVRKEMTRQVN